MGIVEHVDGVDALVRSTPRLDRPVVVAVDGVAGSGKTTFAAQLAARYAGRQRTAHVVHMDDFLHPRAIRYRLGRDSPEGYFRDTYDLHTFITNVIEPLSDGGGRSIRSRAFDYRTDRPIVDNPVLVRAGDVVIVEGMFLLRDEWAHLWDVSVFLDVPFSVSVSVRRMADRDGTNPDPDDPSVRRYVEGQRIYLGRCQLAQRAHHVVRVPGVAAHEKMSR
ncbi:MAG: uridine kinase [Jatrophihabitans sp.]|uniref:uridine kinase n=1 Tax=Jatrophihabitans sp. TaxID=1932789 RepID=UPI003914FE51